MSDWLPELVLLRDYEGDWGRYLEAIYAIFRADFIATFPNFRGRPCRCKLLPVIDGKEGTFWHLISTGSDEANRLPDLRRSERIRWPRPITERDPARGVCVWSNMRGRERRWVVALNDFSYVVVLADRGSYVLIWTAYPVDREHQRAKLRREYEVRKS